MALNPAGLDLLAFPLEYQRALEQEVVTGAGSLGEYSLIEYEHAKHGFHYPGGNGHFDEAIDATARFLLERVAADRPV